MTDSILVQHSDLTALLQSAIDKRAKVELLDPKQAFFQLKSAYDYIQSELAKSEQFSVCPVVIRGRVDTNISVGQTYLAATLFVDVVLSVAQFDDGLLYAITLREDEDDPTVDLNVFDVTFSAPPGYDYVTEAFDLNIQNTVVQGQSDLPADYILNNLKGLSDQFSKYLDFSSIHTAIENMSVALANSK